MVKNNYWVIGGNGKSDFTTSILIEWYSNEVKNDLEFERIKENIEK